LVDAKENIQYRQIALFYKADEDYGARLDEGLGLDVVKVKDLATWPKRKG
jgi:catalase